MEDAIRHIPGGIFETPDYDKLLNKPAIDGTTLEKDSTSEGLGLATEGELSNLSDKIDASVNDLTIKVESVEGRGGYLNAYDFGTAAPSQDALTQYALEQIGITDPTGIWNGTHVRNLYVDPATIDPDHPNGILDGHVWALTNTPDTDPPIFEWADDGPEGTGQATNRRYGAVMGTEDPGDGSKDGAVTVKNGRMETIGFSKIPALPLTIANGGTGATSAEAARANLEAASASSSQVNASNVFNADTSVCTLADNGALFTFGPLLFGTLRIKASQIIPASTTTSIGSFKTISPLPNGLLCGIVYHDDPAFKNKMGTWWLGESQHLYAWLDGAMPAGGILNFSIFLPVQL
jgi:hypothetical protein